MIDPMASDMDERLAEMIAAHEISESRALDIARGYLHDNAAALYK